MSLSKSVMLLFRKTIIQKNEVKLALLARHVVLRRHTNRQLLLAQKYLFKEWFNHCIVIKMDQAYKLAATMLEQIQEKNDVKADLTALISELKIGPKRKRYIETKFEALGRVLKRRQPSLWKEIEEIRNSLETGSIGIAGASNSHLPPEHKTRPQIDTDNEMSFMADCLTIIIEILENNSDSQVFPKPDERLREKVGKGYDYAVKVASLCKEIKSEMRQLKLENKYLTVILESLHRNIIAGESTSQKELKPPEDLMSNQAIVELSNRTQKIIHKFYELETELDYVQKRISKLSSMITGVEGSNIQIPNQERTNIFTAMGRKPRSILADTPPQTERSLKLDKDLELLVSELRNIKENESQEEKLKDENEFLVGLLNALHDSVTRREDLLSKKQLSATSGNRLSEYNMASKIFKMFQEIEILKVDIKTESKQKGQDKLQRLEEENIALRKKADSLRSRLSQVAGAKLAHENPAIADFSDPNRPTKVEEKYSQLYDNEWTEAYAALLNDDTSASDEKLTGYLYNILIDSYRFCEDIRKTQKKRLEDILFHPAVNLESGLISPMKGVSEILAKHLSDATKVSVEVASLNMVQAFVMDKDMKTKYGKRMQQCKAFIEECVKLFWLMHVQTPPLCIDTKTTKGEQLEKEKYKEYTRKGQKIAFVVWPALFLHENGPLVAKGVAQGE